MKKVLSIDGGGIRGIIAARVLAEIEERTERSASEMFDLIAGTSTGGIIALCLCMPTSIGGPAYSADMLARLYEERGSIIFSRSPWKRVSSIGGLADEKYSAEALEKILDAYMGDTMMDAALTRCMVTAYDILGRRPVMIKSWNGGHSVHMRFAARATSAAPTYFEPVKGLFNGLKVLVDGGVCVNNPAMCAYAEARRLWPEEEILVVSLGTGEATRPIEYEDAVSWGLLEWAGPVISVMMDGQLDAPHYQLEQILGANYYRFQGRLELANDDMDDASRRNIAALKEEARRIVAAQEGERRALCARLKAKRGKEG